MAKGIDIQINRMITRFSENLFTDKDCDWFGRIFRNERDGEIIPERFIEGKDYQEVLLNDKKDLTCFFDVQPNESHSGGILKSEVWICFSVNLKLLYPTVRERATEYVHEDVIREIKRVGNWKFIGLVRDKPAFAEYGNVKDSDNFHPYYLFRINCEVKYNNC